MHCVSVHMFSFILLVLILLVLILFFVCVCVCIDVCVPLLYTNFYVQLFFQVFFVCLQVLNVQVPFFFKYAVDEFSKLPDLSTPGGAVITVTTALLLGCEFLCTKC